MPTTQILVLYTGLLLTALNIFEKIAILRNKAQQPTKENEERIDALEEEMKEVKNHLNNDDERIKGLKEGERVMLKSMGALLSHGIDGNNISEMRLAREELNEHLLQR